MTRRPVVLAPGEGRAYPMGRISAVFKADGAETDGRYSISEWWLEPHTMGPGAHSHAEDDVFFVFEGTMSFLVDTEWTDAPAGSFVLVPGGVTHDFENRGDRRCGALNISAPGGFEPAMPGISEWFLANPPGHAGPPAAAIHLREITDENRDAVKALRVRKSQRRFVDSVKESLKDAKDSPEDNPWYRAVYRGDTPVGFVMLEWNAPNGPKRARRYFLWKFLIDKDHQGGGIGREVIRQVADLVHADGGTELFTSYEPGKGNPGPFYDGLGFRPTGKKEDGEIVLRVALPLEL